MGDSTPSRPSLDKRIDDSSYPDTGELATSDYYVSVGSVQLLWLSRTLGRTFIAPFDRVKFILQCQRELQRLGTLQGSFRGARHCVKHLVAIEGWRSLWRGNLIQVISLLPITIAQIFIALPTQSFVFDAFPHYSTWGFTFASYVAVLAGALAAATVSYPFEFARFRLAVDIKRSHGASYEYRHSLAFFSHPVLNESPHLLYKGLGLYVLGSIVYQSAHNGMLNIFGLFVPPETPEGGYGVIAAQVGAGLTVSALSTLCLHPVDTVRRRMMIAATEDDLRYPSTVDCVRHIMRTEGPIGFYRGAAFSLVRVMVTTALFVMSGISI